MVTQCSPLSLSIYLLYYSKYNIFLIIYNNSCLNIINFFFFFLDLEKSLANANGTGGTLDYMESPVSDGTIEENFEEELVNAPQVIEGITSINDKESGSLSDDLDAYDVCIINS